MEAQSLYVVLTANGTQYKGVIDEAARDTRKFGNEVDRTGAKLDAQGSVLDRYSTRVGLLGKALLAVMPAFPGVAAAAVPALAATANVLGAATAAAGVTAIAFHGVGDALGALQKAQLEPTAENLAEVRRQLADLSPQAADFVLQINDLIPALKDVRDVAAAGLFPGASEAVADLDDALPRLERFAGTYAEVVGDLLAAGAEDLTSGRWSEFVDFLEGEARPTLTTLGGVVGDLAHGMTELWMALDPASDDLLGGLADGAEVFDKWASGLKGSEGLESFLAYVKETGPEVVDTAMSLAEAVVSIGQAAAPLTGPVLDGIQALAGAVETVASSPLGGTVVGLAATSSVAGLARQGLSSAASSPVGQGVAEAIANAKELAAALKDSSQAEEESAQASSENAEEKSSLADSVEEAAEKASELSGANEQAADSDKKASAAASKNAQAQQSRAAALRQSAAALGKQAALMGGVMLASTGAADGIGLASTATFALTGAMMGGAFGAAIGGGVGLLMDFKNAGNAAEESIRGMQDAIDSGDFTAMQTQLDAFRERNEKYLDGDWTFGDTLTQGLRDALSWGGHSDELRKGEELARSVEEAAEAQAAYNGALRDGGRAAYEAKYGIDGLVKSMADQQAQARAALDSQFAWGQAVQGIRQLIRDGSDGFNEYTQAGQANFSAISQAADALNGMVEAGDLTNREYVKMRKEFIGFAKDLGASTAEARAFANELLDFPDALAPQIGIQFDKQELVEAKAAFDALPLDVRSEIRAEGIPQTEAAVDALVEKYKLTERERNALLTLKDQASDRIQEVLGLLRQYRDKNITVTTTFQNFYKGPKKDPSRSSPGLGLLSPDYENANGGLYAYGDGGLRFADGGYGADGRYYDRASRIVAGGANVLWGELETGWEAYISGKPGQEARNREIWAEAGRRLGFDFSPRGHARPAAAPNGSSTVVVQSAMPESLELVVDGQRFTAYVRGHAADVSARQLDAAGRSGESSERMNWS